MKCAHCRQRLALLPSTRWDGLLFCSAHHRDAYRKARQQDARIAQFVEWRGATLRSSANKSEPLAVPLQRVA